ncbi:MAG: indolepyruvate ferredoxin oxidoreductase family protein, partial [Arenibacterium sp.]
KRVYDIPDARFGIVTTGKGHLDTLEALRLLGLDEAACRRLGIDIYKVGMVWPLARRDALAFVRGKEEVLVIEEKRGIIESQFKEYFYDWPGDKPKRMVGKHRAAGDPLIPWTGELSPLKLVPVLAERLSAFFPGEDLLARARDLTETPVPVLNVSGATRTPYFCSGCPHNSSTKVPEGSMAASGIGCHVMASWMDRNTVGYAQMGGEGVPWVASSKYNGGKHIFQNLGEGTWYHSGSLAIRQAVAAGTNITYKILYNDAVAMTGGQPVDGPVSVTGIAQTCRAEGVARIALVSDDIGKFNQGDFPPGTSFHGRDALDLVQRELREIKGVSVLIYEQTCATEKRRRRKRGTMDDPKRFAFINDLVCEGCGDCSVESNCLSVEPKETAFGRKRKINLSSCNKDFSCLNGFCPSFVTVEDAVRRRKSGPGAAVAARVGELPAPRLPDLAAPFNLLVAGVGGTGVVTVGALITMAAHLEGKGASVLDFTGFAQKFGTVLGYVRLAATPEQIHQVRIETGAADAVIACDAVVASAPKASMHYRQGTTVVLNRAEMPTGDLVLRRDADLKIDTREQVIGDTVGAGNVSAFDANKAAEALLGDAVFANAMMLGAAWQRGLVPVGADALKQAMELNGVAVERNVLAFDLGRLMAGAPDVLRAFVEEPAVPIQSVQDEIDRRSEFLRGYQDADYAQRFVADIDALRAVLPDDLLGAAAKSLFKLMAYKDEYEVARLMTGAAFAEELDAHFEPGFRVRYHMAPPLISRARDGRGRPKKRSFGAWMTPVLRGLSRMKSLRGSAFDPFRWSHDRKLDHDLLDWYRNLLSQAKERYRADQKDIWSEVLSAPMDIRGYGPVRDKAAAEVKTKVAGLLANGLGISNAA